MRRVFALFAVLVAIFLSSVEGFSTSSSLSRSTVSSRTQLFAFSRNSNRNRPQQQQQQQLPKVQKITSKRRKELGINDDEDEYDLEMALNNNTDPIITKIIAGSLIVSILSLLIYGVVIPLTTDYGEGVCNTLLTGGRC